MISGVLPLFWAISGSSLGGPKSRQGCSGLAPPAGSGAARLLTAWLRYRSYVVVGLQSSIPTIPECLRTRSFARSKQDENSFYDDRRRGMISSTNLTALTIVNSFSFYRNGGLI
ncbi:hypothetical protein MRB53_037224 [Persea americana]|nr:hypothetical protein MRB53_037224 [Persea americana]